MLPALPPTGAQPAPLRPWPLRYGVAVACSVAFVVLRLALNPVLGREALLIIPLAAPLIASWFGGWGPGLLATLLAAVLGDWFLMRPAFGEGVSRQSEWVAMALFLGNGLLFSALNESRLRSLRIAAARQENLLRAQQELALREQRLRETDRRKDEFIAVLAHELRNPLAPVRSAVDILRRLDPADPRAARTREVIARQVGHMTRLVDDLLDVSRIGRGKLSLRISRCNLSTIARETAEDYRASLEAQGLRLLVDVPEAPLWIDGDAVRLAQMLGNLLNNAGRFSQPGGLVTVEAQADRVKREALLRVADTGIGISGELMARLFNPFEQAAQDLSRSRGGLGLGLALTQGLAELHGGRIEAASPGPGQGATFTLHLPLAPAPQAPPPPPAQGQDPAGVTGQQPAPAPGADAAPPGLRILLVEDNHDAAATLAELLSLSGHRVTVCHDGEAGLALARQLRPEVVISDLGLPGEMDGYQLARQLRADSPPSAPYLIALSGYADARARARSHAAGFDEHLSKPPDVDVLESLLARLGNRLGYGLGYSETLHRPTPVA